MTAYTSIPIVDPDELTYDVNIAFATSTKEIVINTTAKTIALKVNGNLTTDGAAIKAVYSKLKDAWRADTTLIKFPFPMGPITDEQFEMINGWNWDKVEESGVADQTTPELLRTGGWSVVNLVGAITEQWFSVITLGSLGDTDQVYYQQVDADEPSVNFTLTGPVNQAVQSYSDPNGDGNVADGYDRRTYFKIFVREWAKTYAQSEINDIGVSSVTFQAYRFPLTNGADLKIGDVLETDIDVNADGIPDQGVYANIDVTYLRDANGDFYTVLGEWATTTAYVVGNVVQGSDGRWYKCITAGTSAGNSSDLAAGSDTGTSDWAVFEGERLIGTIYYPFTIIVDGDTTVGPTASGAARTEEIYQAIQYLLRQNIDIDESTGSVTGKTATSLLGFVGDTLVTSLGVYIDSFNTQDTNNITLTTFNENGSSITVNFPFVAALTVNFGTNLQDDQFAKYWVFFTSATFTKTATGTISEFTIVVSPDNTNIAVGQLVTGTGIGAGASVTVISGTTITLSVANSGAVSGTVTFNNAFGTTAAIIVDDNDGIDMAGDVNPAWPTKRTSVSHSFDYDNNIQGGRAGNTGAPVTVVGIGLTTGQYVSATGSILRSTANSVSLVAALERNYAQGTTFP
jgi:hypothetical protein